MPFNIIGSTTQADALKASLDASSLRVRSIAQRVALGSVPGGAAFSLDGAKAGDDAGSTAPEKIDLESEMAKLSDEQLRFEATAKLLEKTYAGLRASLTDK